VRKRILKSPAKNNNFPSSPFGRGFGRAEEWPRFLARFVYRRDSVGEWTAVEWLSKGSQRAAKRREAAQAKMAPPVALDSMAPFSFAPCGVSGWFLAHVPRLVVGVRPLRFFWIVLWN
jgi:hypothetical protein